MVFNPSLKLSTYPGNIALYFRREATIMQYELQTNRLEVHLKKPVRYAENHNPAWYSKFATEKCANYPANNKRRKRTAKNKTGGRIRQRTLKALNRITRGTDGKLTGDNYSFHCDLRSLIFERLCDGYHSTIESYADHPDSEVPAITEVREFFKIKTDVVVTPVIEDRVPF